MGATVTIRARAPFTLCVWFSGNASQRVVEAQPETRAVMDLILERGYTLSVALDGGSLLATYPYDKPVQSGNAAGLKTAHTTRTHACMYVCMYISSLCAFVD